MPLEQDFNMIKLKKSIRDNILSADLVRDVGFADVSRYRKIKSGGTPFEYLPEARIAIVYAAVADDVMSTFGKWYVVSLNNFMKHTNERIIAILGKHALHSRGIIAERANSDLIGKVSFRQLAVLGGLGTIGRNTFLLHPEYGPNVVLGVVLTDIDLLPDEPLTREFCMDCGMCINECPAGAIGDDFFDRWKCKNRRKALGKGCGTRCIACCPLTNH